MEIILGKGFVAEQHGDRQSAQSFFRAALEAAEKLPDTSPQKRQTMLAASIFFQREGLALAERVLAIDERTLGPDDPQIAVDLGQVATRYNPSDAEGAGKLYDEAVKIAGATSEMDCLDRVSLLGNAAQFYMRQKRYSDAESALRDMLQSASGVPSTHGPFALRARTMLARVLRMEGKSDEAEQLISGPAPASSLLRNTPQNPDLAIPFSDLGRANEYKRQGRQQEAELFYRNAIAELQNVPPRLGLVGLSSALDQLAEICQSQGRNAEAEELLLRSLHLRESNAGPLTIAAIQMLSAPFALQNFYRQQGRLSEMEPVYQQAILIQQKYLGPRAEALSFTYLNAASLFAEEGKFEQSLPMYQHALDIDEQTFGTDSNRLLPSLNGYLEALTRIGRVDQAAQLQARASQIQNQPNSKK